MAFDGPTPFDGDPVYNYVDQVVDQTPDVVQEEFTFAFREVIQGGASGRMPAEFASMLGANPLSVTSTTYVDVDEGVWAWACAEMVAVALGYEPEPTIPEPFHGVILSLPNAKLLAADALEALDIVRDPKRSEVAGLMRDANADEAYERIDNLRDYLQQLCSD